MERKEEIFEFNIAHDDEDAVVVKISKNDKEHVLKHKWRLNKTNGYISGKVNGKTTTLHKHIWINVHHKEKAHGQVIFFKEKGTHNYCISNLRVGPLSDALRGKTHLRKKSKFNGVYWCEQIQKWLVKFEDNPSRRFDEEEDAARFWDACVSQSQYHKDGFYKLNFPDQCQTMEPLTKKPKSTEFTGVYPKGQKWYFVASKHKVCNFKSALDAAIARDDYVVSQDVNTDLNFPDRYPHWVKKSKRECVKSELISLNDTTATVFTSNKEDTYIIDFEDYDRIKNFATFVSDGYVRVRLPDKEVGLSRFLLGVTDFDIVVDHIDRNPKNNSKSNLRACTRGENNQNRSKKVGASSKYYDIYYQKSTKRWIFHMSHNNAIHVRAFNENEEEIAARYRDLYVMRHFKDSLYPLNFPEDWQEEWIVELWSMYFGF